MEKENCRYFHIQSIAEQYEAMEGDSFVNRIIEYATEISETYPRQFISFPGDLEQKAWEPGETRKMDGDSYLVPFILDAGPKAYKKLQEPEEQEK